MGLGTPVRLRFHRYLAAELRRLRDVRRTLTFEPSGRLASLMGLNFMSPRNIDEIEEVSYAEAARRLRTSALMTDLAAGTAGGRRRPAQLPAAAR